MHYCNVMKVSSRFIELYVRKLQLLYVKRFIKKKRSDKCQHHEKQNPIPVRDSNQDWGGHNMNFPRLFCQSFPANYLYLIITCTYFRFCWLRLWCLGWIVRRGRRLHRSLDGWGLWRGGRGDWSWIRDGFLRIHVRKSVKKHRSIYLFITFFRSDLTVFCV